jgi:ATP-dependent DNA helicase RecG
MSFAQRQELLYDKGQATFETRVVPNLSLDTEIVANYARAAGSSDPGTLLNARGLVDDADRVLAADCLLFGLNPQGHFPEAYVRLIKYRGTERGTGSRQQLVEEVRCEGPIPIVLWEAHRQMRTLVPTLRALGSEGLLLDVPSIPEDAWLEGLVKAVGT